MDTTWWASRTDQLADQRRQPVALAPHAERDPVTALFRKDVSVYVAIFSSPETFGKHIIPDHGRQLTDPGHVAKH